MPLILCFAAPIAIVVASITHRTHSSMNKGIQTFVAALLAAVCVSGCPQFSPDGRTPVVINPKMRASTQELCYSDYALLHSGITHGPLWSAEHLTAQNVDAAKDRRTTHAPIAFSSRSVCRRAKARSSPTI